MSASAHRVTLSHSLVAAGAISFVAGCGSPRAPVPVTVTCVSRVEPLPAPPCACPTVTTDAGVAPATPTATHVGTVARWGASWQRATVVGPVCTGFVRVRFETGSPDDAEAVLDLRDVQETDAHGRLPELHPPPPGRPVSATTRLGPGGALLALSGGTWYPATIRQVRRDGTVRIRYDGYGSEWDENLPRASLRLPDREAPTHPTGLAEPRGEPLSADGALPVGALVEARSRGRWFDARVLGHECEGLVRVRFVGWEPAWDAVVERGRLRALGAPRPAE